MRNLLLFFLIIGSVSFGCRRMPDVQGPGDARMQGRWLQTDSSTLNNARHELKFSCDSFYLKLSLNAPINYFADTCATDGKRIEYAKGIYAVKEDTLMLSGTYTKANFKQKISGCYNIGRYRHNFLILKGSKEALTLRDLSNNQTCELILQEKIVCIPKSI